MLNDTSNEEIPQPTFESTSTGDFSRCHQAEDGLEDEFTEKTEPKEKKQSSEIECFAVFRFKHSLGKGIKSRIKSLGCVWNSMHHGWLCTIEKQDEVQKAIQASGLTLTCSPQIISLPKGVISQDPKIAGKQSRLDFLHERIYKEKTELFQDMIRYDPTLRPEDFSHPPSEEGKSSDRIRIEKDFHERWKHLHKTKEAAEQARDEISHLEADKGEKVFDPDAPLLIADSLIKERFLWNGQHRRLQYCSDLFWEWDGVKYVEVSEWGMRKIIYGYLRDAKAAGDKHSDNFNPTKFKVDQVIDALRAVCHNDHHPESGAIWLDGRNDSNPQYLISFRNGLLDMEDWIENPHTPLVPHTPLLLNVNSLTFDFDPHATEPAEWLQFLDSIWPGDTESQETLQEWAGYVLTHDTRLHKILLVIGPPRSGKGTIARCLSELLGHFNVIGPTLSSLGGEFGLQPFLNKMLATISDARLSSKGSNSTIIERLLSISGEDPLTISRKFLPSLTVHLPTRIMMMSNEIPDMRDMSGALAKRYIVLTLTKTWLGNEDTALFNRLRTELPGILLWALRGLGRLQGRGRFRQPKSSAETIADLEAMTSPIKVFVAERCEFKPTGTVSINVLFQAWRIWCDSTGYSHPGNIQSFGKNLRAAFPGIETTRPREDLARERYYKGIILIQIHNPSADVRGPDWGKYE